MSEVSNKRIFGVGFMYVVEFTNIIRKTKAAFPKFDVTVIDLEVYPNLATLRATMLDALNSSITNKFKEKIIEISIISVWEFKSIEDRDSFIAQPATMKAVPPQESSLILDA